MAKKKKKYTVKKNTKKVKKATKKTKKKIVKKKTTKKKTTPKKTTVTKKAAAKETVVAAQLKARGRDTTTINYAVYEGGTEFIGMTEAKMPDLSFSTEKVTGAGIMGEIEEIMIGRMSAMTVTFSFKTITAAAVKLLQAYTHTIDLRVAQQQIDTSGNSSVVAIKHVLKIKPKKLSLGKIESATKADVSGEYAVIYYALYIKNEKVTEIDPYNCICKINGTDYLSNVNSVLNTKKKKKTTKKKKKTTKKKKKKK